MYSLSTYITNPNIAIETLDQDQHTEALCHTIFLVKEALTKNTEFLSPERRKLSGFERIRIRDEILENLNLHELKTQQL